MLIVTRGRSEMDVAGTLGRPLAQPRIAGRPIMVDWAVMPAPIMLPSPGPTPPCARAGAEAGSPSASAKIAANPRLSLVRNMAPPLVAPTAFGDVPGVIRRRCVPACQ